MRKTFKRFLSGFAILILLFIVLFVGYLLTARYIIKGMATVASGETVKNVFSVKDTFVNLYLVKSGEHYIAIDAGNDAGIIKSELNSLGIDPGKIDAVLLTHTDGDHVAGLSIFKNAGIYISKQEEQLINGKTSRFFLFGNKIDSDKYKLLEDQQVINIDGVEIQCFLTPGHTPGSMCYLVNDTLLFTGDALRLNQGKVENFYRLFTMDSHTMAESIGKIIRIPGVQYIFTAHNGYSGNFTDVGKDWTLNNKDF